MNPSPPLQPKKVGKKSHRFFEMTEMTPTTTYQQEEIQDSRPSDFLDLYKGVLNTWFFAGEKSVVFGSSVKKSSQGYFFPSSKNWFVGGEMEMMEEVVIDNAPNWEVQISNIFLFSPRTLGKMICILTHIFQRGWFNHQLVKVQEQQQGDPGGLPKRRSRCQQGVAL